MSSKELVISQGRHETKVGILEDGQLVEVFFQRANEYSLAGSIHKGRVTRVLPGMQSAFVDLGLERDCFLYVSDFFEEHADEIDRVGDDRRGGRDRDRDPGRDRDRDRGRGRGRDRSREPEGASPVIATPVEGADSPAAAPAEGPDASPAAAAADRDDQRGRRSRRRRRGGRGFPESKYASASDSDQRSGDESAPLDSEPAGGTVETAAEPRQSDDAEVILLPGESLRKYRQPAPALSSDEPAPAPEPTPDELQAAAEEAAAEAAESILDRVEELEHRGAAPIDSDEEPEEDPDEESDDDSGEESGEEPGDEPDAEPGPDSEAPDMEPAPAELPGDGEEASGAPQSLTATVRAEGGRSPHRISRRMRRRGRGGRGQDAPAEGGSALDAAGEGLDAPATPELRQPSFDRPERPQRSDRPEPPERGDRRERERERSPLPSIADLLREGQEIIVQIAKEPLGQKGARITSHIALPGRYVVYMPTVEHLGVSRRISTDEERQRLKRILQKHREGVAGGYIMRTAGEGRTEEEIQADMQFLASLWLDIKAKAEKRRAPALLHHDVEVVQRLIRDQLTDGFKAVWVDNEELYEQVLHSVERVAPALLSRVKLYTRPESIFDAFGITQELEKALRPKVWLKSGGYIVINQTEALVAIDVNTGKYVGKSNRLEDTIVKTNLEAVKEIVRQMRLRDLGGIIVVDFIDMDERKNRQKVMQSLEETMRADKAPYKILQFNDFGLVAITRKRVKQSLERALCSPCPECEGAGYLKSVTTVIGEILAQAQKYAKVVDTKDVVLRVNPEVAKMLNSIDNEYLEELEEVLGRPVLVTADPLLHQEKFDLA
ncbi:MAG: Rne/Rng family ribonuclease [Candidatus Solibacter usitatus]|nr:Rne/Rng family ribonuclease [Candidatus Solibacter usitatus]